MSALVFKIDQHRTPAADTPQQQTEQIQEKATESPDTPVSEQAAGQAMSEGAPAAPTPENVTVKVDGPIGRVFTDALNKVLSLEDYMTMLPTDEPTESKDAPTGGAKDTQNLIQVYCWRTDAVNASDLVQLSDMITRHTDRTFVVALEAAHTMKSAVGVLDSLQCYPNLKVCYSVESAARYVKGLACPSR